MPRRVADRYRTAFVTGAAEGLGRAITEMLVAEGVRVWATSRELRRLDPVVAAAGGRVTALAMDLSDPAACRAAWQTAAAQAGGVIDLLINNAGYGIFGEFGAVPAELWARQWSAMLAGTMELTQAAWNGWGAARRGALVNVSSLAAEFPIPFMSGYNVAKAGLSALSESLRFETRGRPVSVIDFRPGDYRTGFNRSMQHRSAPGQSLTGEAATVWSRLDAILNASPSPVRAARDLRRALLRGRSGPVRSGRWFQAVLAPLYARLVPQSWVHRASVRYFGLR
jgi:NAD(P)-dependent dehydrogenase (short-subunit alcohol dehydrogenase family)